ncbi:MAG: glycine zipper family protein [Acidobacteriota bacterium]|nr:glycine zipper family protein [Acidobacteriota bacterium]
MLKKMNKSVFLAMLTLGVLFILATPDAMAQDRCRTRGRSVGSNYNNVGNYNNRNYDNRNYRDSNYRNSNYYQDNSNYRGNSNYRDDRYYGDYENTTGNAVKRAAIGAGIGTLGGAVIGGKKGALIGAGIGAAGGYIYHRNKVNNERRRY